MIALIVIAGLILFVLINILTQYLYEKRWVRYEISKGKHFSRSKGSVKINLEEDRTLKFIANFTPSCLYELSNNNTQINKLYGFSCGRHHNYSARIGWRCADKETGQIELYAYWYDGSDSHKSQYLGYTYINTPVKLQIKATKHSFDFILYDNIHHDSVENQINAWLEDKRNCTFMTRFKLFPYFGGQQPAPHDMVIEIFEID